MKKTLTRKLTSILRNMALYRNMKTYIIPTSNEAHQIAQCVRRHGKARKKK